MSDEQEPGPMNEQSLLDLLELVEAQQARADKMLDEAKIQRQAIDAQRRQVQELIRDFPARIESALTRHGEILGRIGTEIRDQGTQARHTITEASKAMRWKTLAVFGVAAFSVILASATLALFAWFEKQEMLSMQNEKTELVANIADLKKRGGKVKLHTCGDQNQLCVKVDKNAGSYGNGDFMIVKGR